LQKYISNILYPYKKLTIKVQKFIYTQRYTHTHTHTHTHTLHARIYCTFKDN